MLKTERPIKMLNRFYVDTETRSACDLRDCGAYVYAEHPSTELLCIVGKLNGKFYTDLSEILKIFYENPEITMAAHNFMFDRLIINRMAGIKLPLERLVCTAAKVRAHGLPAS